MSLIRVDEPRRWLFCMTHPDDEISICVLMRRLVQAGHEVFLSWTHSPDFRLEEGRLGAKLLGIPEANLFSHGSTDGSTCDELAVLLPKFQAMMASARPDVVVCGAFEQGHLDHDATNWLVNQSFDGEVLEVPFYHTYVRPRLQRINQFSDPTEQEVLALSSEERRFKLDFAKLFRSQNIWSVLMTFEVVSTLLFQPAKLSTRELVRRQTHCDFRVPNHPEPLARRVAQTPQWQRWLSALQAFEDSQA